VERRLQLTKMKDSRLSDNLESQVSSNRASVNLRPSRKSLISLCQIKRGNDLFHFSTLSYNQASWIKET